MHILAEQLSMLVEILHACRLLQTYYQQIIPQIISFKVTPFAHSPSIYPSEPMFHNIALTRERPEKPNDHVEHFCDQAERHGHQPIQYICLDDACALNRKCCKLCVMEKHRRHRVGSIDKLIAPLNYLSINSHTEKSDEHYNFFREKIEEVTEEWHKITEQFEKCRDILSNTIILKMEAIKNTFNSQDIDKAYDLILDPNSTIQQINDYVKIINFLDKKENLDDVEQLRAQVSKVSRQAIHSIKKASDKVNSIMSKLMFHFSKYTFTSQPTQLGDNHDDTIEADAFSEVKKEQRPKKQDRKEERREEKKQERKSEKKEEVRDERREEKKEVKQKRLDDTRHDPKKKDIKQDAKPSKESTGNLMQKYQQKRFGENKKFGEPALEQDQDQLYYDSAEEQQSPPASSYTQTYAKNESEPHKTFNLFQRQNDQKTRYK